jgi:hypothetical protein
VTYRELIDGLKGASDAALDTEVCGFEGGLIFWASRLEFDAEGRPILEGTNDVGA